MSISEAKERVTVATLGERLYPGWKPAKSCRRPWGEDRNPSFSVYDGFQRWKDHATGEGGDALDFLQRSLDISKQEACRQFVELAGGRLGAPEVRVQNPRPPVPEPDTLADSAEKKTKRAGWPKFDHLTLDELEALSALRSLPFGGPEWAAIDGVLRGTYSSLENVRSWVVVSSCGRNAQARRLDGKPFDLSGRELKAKTLPGSLAQIPVGRYFDTRFPLVVVVEGGPDVLAAYAAIHRLGLLDKVSVCGVLGAGMRIPPGAIASMAGRRVRILQHNDSAGYKAADEWAKQLHGCRAKVDIWTPGADGADLNDVFKLLPEVCEQEISEAFDFAKGGCEDAGA
jgi:hypothetical protein